MSFNIFPLAEFFETGDLSRSVQLQHFCDRPRSIRKGW